MSQESKRSVYAASLSVSCPEKGYRGTARIRAVNTKDPEDILLEVPMPNGDHTFIRADFSGLEKGEKAKRMMQDFGVSELPDLIGKCFELEVDDRYTVILRPLKIIALATSENPRFDSDGLLRREYRDIDAF